MKKLFGIKNINGKLVKDLWFDNKMKAKETRNEMNKESQEYVVTKGPDHIGNHGHRTKFQSWKNR